MWNTVTLTSYPETDKIKSKHFLWEAISLMGNNFWKLEFQLTIYMTTGESVSAEKPFELEHFLFFGNPAICFSFSVVYHFVLSNRAFVLQRVIFILTNRLETNSYELNLLGGRLISC